MIISIHEGSTCDRFGPEKGYAMLKRAGIDGIQFGMGHYLMPGKVVRAGGPSIMDEPLETIIEAVRPYKEAADKAGIVVSQVHAPFPVWVEYSEDINRRMIDITRKAIAVTEYMGSHQCIIHPAAPQENNKRLSDEEEWAINKAIYTALIPDLKQHHVMGMLENLFSRGDEGTRFASVCSDFYEAARWIDELNEIAGEELFGFCFDTGHCHLARENVYRAVKLMGPRIKALHMHDNAGHLDQHVAPYTGTLDWEGFLRGMKEIGYRGDLNFEAPNAIDKYPPEMAEECLRLLAAVGRYFEKRITEEYLPIQTPGMDDLRPRRFHCRFSEEENHQRSW